MAFFNKRQQILLAEPGEMKIAIKYSVENGEIKKQTKPGQEKYESCKVVEKDGSKMILKCPFLYYFLTKI